MPVSSRTELVAALSRQAFDEVLGTSEGDWLDFKGQPYEVAEGKMTSRGRWSLASDVACFANGRGGVIVIGFRTHRPQNAIVEEASDVALVPKELINAEAYAAVISMWVYPGIVGITMTWFPPDLDVDKGVFVLDIPAQPEHGKPFLVRKSVDLDGRTVDSWSGRVREGDRCQPIPIERLHAQMTAGRLAERTAAAVVPINDAVDRLNELLDKTRRRWTADEGIATYAILCTPRTPQPMPRFYAADSGARVLLQNPPSLRPYGFNLSHEGEVELDAGAFQASWSETAIRAEPDGSACAIAAATEDFLGWSVNDRLPSPSTVRLNPLALVEFTLEAARLMFAIIALGDQRPRDYIWRLSARGMQTRRVALERGQHRRIFPGGAQTASADDWTQVVDPAADPEALAFHLLERFYALFGLGADAIPYSRDGHVDIDAIMSVQG